MTELHGLDAELAAKAKAKYDKGAEANAVSWIEEVTSLSLGGKFWEGLKNGVVLCALLNCIAPGTIPKYTRNPKHYLEEKANISKYVAGLKKLGVASQDQISPLDLSETKRDDAAVLQNIYAVARQAQAIGWKGPLLGARYYKTVEDQLRLERKKEKERELEQKKLEEYERKQMARREYLEGEKKKKHLSNIKLESEKRKSRRERRKSRGSRHHLRKNSSATKDGEAEDRSPSPIRYGLDLEIQKKREDRYDHAEEDKILDWLEDITGIELDSFHKDLKTGYVLCTALNCIRPGSVAKIHKGGAALLQRENITSFLRACVQRFGVKEVEMFHQNDLFEKKNLGAVVSCLYALNRSLSSDPEYEGPIIAKTRKGYRPKGIYIPELHGDDNLTTLDEIEEDEKDLLTKDSSNRHQMQKGFGSFTTLSNLTSPIPVGGRLVLMMLLSLTLVLLCSGSEFSSITLAFENISNFSIGQRYFLILFPLLSFTAGGLMLEFLGPKITVITGLILSICGNALLGYKYHLDNDQGGALSVNLVGFYLLKSSGGPIILTSVLHIASLFKSRLTFVLGFIWALYFSSGLLVPLIMSMINHFLPSLDLAVQQYILAAMCGIGLVIAFFIWPWRKFSISSPHPAMFKEEHASFFRTSRMQDLKRLLKHQQFLFAVLLFVIITFTLAHHVVTIELGDSGSVASKLGVDFDTSEGRSRLLFVVLGILIPSSLVFGWVIDRKNSFKLGFLVLISLSLFISLLAFGSSITYLRYIQIVLIAIQLPVFWAVVSSFIVKIAGWKRFGIIFSFICGVAYLTTVAFAAAINNFIPHNPEMLKVIMVVFLLPLLCYPIYLLLKYFGVSFARGKKSLLCCFKRGKSSRGKFDIDRIDHAIDIETGN